MIGSIIVFIILIIVLILIWIKIGGIESELIDMRENGVHESLQMSISEESIQSIVDLVIDHLNKTKNETV